MFCATPSLFHYQMHCIKCKKRYNWFMQACQPCDCPELTWPISHALRCPPDAQQFRFCFCSPHRLEKQDIYTSYGGTTTMLECGGEFSSKDEKPCRLQDDKLPSTLSCLYLTTPWHICLGLGLWSHWHFDAVSALFLARSNVHDQHYTSAERYLYVELLWQASIWSLLLRTT